MTVIKIRWRVIYQLLVCSRNGHDPIYIEGIPFGSEYQCKRCLLRRPSWRHRRDSRGVLWTDYLDWDGQLLDSKWMAGPVDRMNGIWHA